MHSLRIKQTRINGVHLDLQTSSLRCDIKSKCGNVD